jgi:hypothetical protein
MASIAIINRLWEESKFLHRSNARARANDFRKDFEKTWSLFQKPLFVVVLFSFIIPFCRRRFIQERNVVRNELKKIVVEYIPQIREWLVQWEDGFDQWEHENAGPDMCGSCNALRREKEGRDNANRLSEEMIAKIGAIPRYNWHFHLIDDPTTMVTNPYPGFLTAERALNYCDFLMQVFG